MSTSLVVTWEIHFRGTDQRSQETIERQLKEIKKELTVLLFDYDIGDNGKISCMVANAKTLMRVINTLGEGFDITVEVCGDVDDGSIYKRQIKSKAALLWDFDMVNGMLELGPRR